MVNSGENHKIASTAIIFNWDMMFRGGSTAVVGHTEGRIGFLSLSVTSDQ